MTFIVKHSFSCKPLKDILISAKYTFAFPKVEKLLSYL